MSLQPGNIKVCLCGGDTVGIIAEEGLSLFTPQVACEIAQSLLDVALDADPTLDVEAIMKAYKERTPGIKNVTYIN